MFRINSAICVLLFTILGCESNNNEWDKIPEGVYTGTFQRLPASDEGKIAHVTVTIYSNLWSGESDIIKYPALCYGTYQYYNHKIIFTNSCPWTADFDVSLILGGEYDFRLNGNQLEIIRSYPGRSTDTNYDIYSLTFQKQKAFR
jgi:hypothetical protein